MITDSKQLSDTCSLKVYSSVNRAKNAAKKIIEGYVGVLNNSEIKISAITIPADRGYGSSASRNLLFVINKPSAAIIKRLIRIGHSVAVIREEK